MKAKITCDWIVFNTNIELKEGTIIDVDPNIKANAGDVLSMEGGMCYLCQYNNKHFYVPIIHLDIDFSKKDIDEEQRRFELVRAAMPSILESRYRTSKNPCEIVSDVIGIADEVIKQLKESEETK